MKMHMLAWLIPALCVGCLQVPKSPAKPTTAPAATAQAPGIPPVRAEQVNEKNARTSARALQEELDRATQEASDKPAEPAQQVTQARHQ